MSTRQPLSGQVATVWSRRRLLASLALGGLATPTLASLLAACDDPTAGPATDPSVPGATDPGSSSPDTSSPEPGITHPSGPDSEVLRLTWEAGMMLPWMTQYPPTLLLSGDGRVFAAGAVPEIYPGPLVAPVTVRTITEGGVQTILAMLDDEGLLENPTPDYEVPGGFGIADASTVRLSVAADGEEFVHRAYALGFDSGGSEATPDRVRLLDVIGRLSDLPTLVGASVGAEEVHVPEVYRVYAWPADPAYDDPNVEPTVVAWPPASGVVLAEIVSVDMAVPPCALVAAEAVGELFAAANQLTVFEEAGVRYRLSVVVDLPGDQTC